MSAAQKVQILKQLLVMERSMQVSDKQDKGVFHTCTPSKAGQYIKIWHTVRQIDRQTVGK